MLAHNQQEQPYKYPPGVTIGLQIPYNVMTEQPDLAQFIHILLH